MLQTAEAGLMSSDWMRGAEPGVDVTIGNALIGLHYSSSATTSALAIRASRFARFPRALRPHRSIGTVAAIVKIIIVPPSE
jgi:hypothetical protein